MEHYQDEFKQIKKFLLENPHGLTVSEISKKLNINRNSVAKYLEVLSIAGHVEMKSVGPAKVFFLLHRVPLSAMLNFSSDYIFVLDRNLRIVQINDNLLSLMNVKKEVLLGRSIHECPDKVFTSQEMISKIKNALNGKDSTVEISFKKAKKEFYFGVKLIPTTFEDGDIGATIVLEDITRQKRVEEALRKSEEKYRFLFDVVPVGIGIADIKGRVLDCNQGMTKITGYTLNDLKNINLADTYVNPNERKALIKALKENGKVRDWKVKLKRKDGTVYSALLNVDLVEINGQKVNLTTARDITKRKRNNR